VVWGGGNGYRDSVNRVKDTRYWVFYKYKTRYIQV